MNNAVGTYKLGMKTRLGYAVGDFGANLAFQVVAFYLLFFYTDVFRLSPAVAGGIFLFSKIWDALTDPVMGYIVGNTSSRWGGKRPYLLFGAAPLGLSVFLLFMSPDLNELGRIIYALLTFTFFSTAVTVVNVPYLALTPVMTDDYHERSVITGYRVFLGIIGTLTAAGVTLLLVSVLGNGSQVQGFRRTGIVYGLAIGIVTIVTFLTVKERNTVEKRRKSGIKEILRALSINKPFIILTTALLLVMTATGIMAILIAYYFKYCLLREELTSAALLSLFVSAAISIPLFVKLSSRLGKKKPYIIGMSMVVIALIVIFFVGDREIKISASSIPMILPLLIFGGVGLSTNWLSPWSMLPDTVEYSKLKSGHNYEGPIYGVFYFVFKLGSAIAGYSVGYILELIGYVANVEQPADVKFGITALFTLLPSALLIIGTVVVSFFPINPENYEKIKEDINN